jgi:DNA-binding protein YbaB
MGFLDQIKDINNMRQQAKQMQMLLAQEEIVGQSKDGYIKLTIDGNQEIKSVEVADGVVGDRKRIAQDIREAMKDINDKYKKLMTSKFGHMLKE